MEKREQSEQTLPYKYVIEYRQSSTRYGRGFSLRAAGDDLNQVSAQALAMLGEALAALRRIRQRCADVFPDGLTSKEAAMISDIARAAIAQAEEETV